MGALSPKYKVQIRNLLMTILIITLAVFFAMNMGGASFAASFGSPIGASIIHRRYARFLFLFFVMLGAVILGKNVSLTLGEDIVPINLLTPKAIALVFFAAGLSMLVANLMHIPQSTSLVTVAAIAGVGAYYESVNIKTILFLLPFWILLPVISFILTYATTKMLYPPRKSNFWIYERFINHEDKLKAFVIITSCYNAFSVGTNNVANVVGPLLDSNISIVQMLLGFAFVYGGGAFIFKGATKTVSKRIVPLGLLTVSIISIVSGSLMIFASAIGVPQSFVMLQLGAVFAVSSLKDGHDMTLANPVTQKTFYTWTINPILTFLFAYGAAFIVLK